MSIRTPSGRTRDRNLSGGNQQKVIFAKWLNARCRILLIDEATEERIMPYATRVSA